MKEVTVMRRIAKWVALSAVFLFALSCQEELPSSPGEIYGEPEILTFEIGKEETRLECPLYSEKFIKAEEGGEVKVSFDLFGISFEYKVTIPPGALPQDTTVSLSVPYWWRCDWIIEPSGIEFSIPVTISNDIEGIEFPEELEDELSYWWYDEELGTWLNIGGDIEIEDDSFHAEVELSHFSRYALGQPSD